MDIFLLDMKDTHPEIAEWLTGAYDSFEKGIRKSRRVDGRFSVLDFMRGENFLHITTDSISVAHFISRAYQKISSSHRRNSQFPFRIKVVLLPDRSVGGLVKGVCQVGVAPVRKLNLSSSEQVTQVLFGESFDTLQIVGRWVRVRLDADGYVGWISSDQIVLFTEDEFLEYCSRQVVYATDKVLSFFESPSSGSVVVREAVFGSRIVLRRKAGNFIEVRLPDDSSAFVKRIGVSDSPPVKLFTTKNLLKTARSFQGISYIWGGRSPKGFDCSGFVQTVFRFNGIELPRDADLQFSSGKMVGKDVKKFRPGDLLFFSSNGHKINHVALYLGGHKEFIHSSGFVRINSFEPRRRNFDERLLSNFVGACRIVSDVKSV